MSTRAATLRSEYFESVPEVSANGNHKPERPKLTLRSPDEILAMQFDDSDIILGDRLLAKGQGFVLAGAGGLGKSRLLTQLAACVVTRREFLTFPTGGCDLRWLILQTENSNRRYHADLGPLKSWLGGDWEIFNEKVVFHTVEHDSDADVSLDSVANQNAIAEAIEASRADVIGLDPLNDFGIGDLSKDADMRATVSTLTRTCRRGNPERAIAVCHHALTGKAGAAKATGFDRSSFSRNSKVLFAWTRGQINLAPVDPANNDRLIVACGKCSNGREFSAFGIKLDPERMIYVPDPTIDVATWETEMSGKHNAEPLMTPERVRELCRMPKSKAELAHAIREDCGCARTVAYKYIKRAEKCRKIHFNERTESYAQK
jgi:hypothetical protein